MWVDFWAGEVSLKVGVDFCGTLGGKVPYERRRGFSFPFIPQFLSKARGGKRRREKSHYLGERWIWNATPPPPLPTLPLQLPWWVAGAAVSCGCLAEEDTLRIPPHSRLTAPAPAPASLLNPSALWLPGGGVGAALGWGDRRARARGHATPQRIPVTAEIAEIGCN